MKKSSNAKKLLTYEEYLHGLNKKSLTNILNIYHIDCPKNTKKAEIEKIIINNISNITKYTFSLFQNDEFINLKLLIKKKGHIKIKVNNLLLNFLTNLEKRYLVIKLDEKEYYMPRELLQSYKNKIKNKSTNEIIKNNTEEYNLILGFIDAYGIVDFDYFYFNYTKIYKLTKEDAQNRLENLANFYNEFNIYHDKNKMYLASITVKTLKECRQYIKRLGNYAVYTNEELIEIHTLKCLRKNRTYKKLVKFIGHHYDINKGSLKVINKNVLKPYLIENQKNSETAENTLSQLIDNYFEFNNNKLKNKFIELVKANAQDYPKWNLKGSKERIENEK